MAGRPTGADPGTQVGGDAAHAALLGRAVRAPDGAWLGRVEAVVVSLDDDLVLALEVGVAGGIRALPWRAVLIDGEELHARSIHLLAGDAPAFYRRHGRRLTGPALLPGRSHPAPT